MRRTTERMKLKKLAVCLVTGTFAQSIFRRGGDPLAIHGPLVKRIPREVRALASIRGSGSDLCGRPHYAGSHYESVFLTPQKSGLECQIVIS